jgi:hypothetical protein
MCDQTLVEERDLVPELVLAQVLARAQMDTRKRQHHCKPGIPQE